MSDARTLWGRRGASGIISVPSLSLTLLLMAGSIGCEQKPDADGNVAVLGAVTAGVGVSGLDILGFEATAGWKAASGTESLSTTAHTQGGAALALTAPQNYTTLVSLPLTSGLAPLAGLANAGSSVELDLELPTSQPNPYYLGAIQLYISVPSHGVYNQYLGQSELTGQQLGTFQTYQFAVTTFVQTQLAGATYSDLTFTIALNAPSGAKGTYLLDNLRTTSPATAEVGAGPSVDLNASLSQSPTTSAPGQASFATGTIQIPASFHVKVGDSGKGTALFELGFGSTTSVSCTYVASSDTTSYLFSSCATGNVAGDIVAASFARLTLQSADPSAPLTTVRAQLAYNALGDQVGTKLVPPIPTFWGDTLAEINTISQSFAQLQLANLPPEPRFVSLPIPDFAKRQGDGTPVNALGAGGGTPHGPSDPPFDVKGDLNNSSDGSPSGMFDAYYEISGTINGTATKQDFTSHFDTSGVVGVRVLGSTVPVLQVNATIDSDNGGTTSSGSSNPTSTATFQAFLFGAQFENDTTTQQTGFDFNPSTSFNFETPPIQIWIFSVQGGVGASVGVDFSGSLTANGFSLAATPNASVTANIQGGINILVASGQVNVTVDLIEIQVPVTADLTFAVSTEPGVCAATLNANVNGQVKLSSGGGSVALVASLGDCPFCITHSWNIFDWSGFNLGTVQLPGFPLQIASDTFPLPSSLCDLPLTVAITRPKATTTALAGVGLPTLASATRQATAMSPLGDPIACQFITWSSSDPGATFTPSAIGCSPLVTFSAATGGTTQTLTATALDQFGEKGAATVKVSVSQPMAGPIPVIVSPGEGADSVDEPFVLQGTVTGGRGTVTATWSLDGTPINVQTVAPGTNVALAPVTEGTDLGDHTFELTATDTAGNSNSVSVDVSATNLQ